MSRTFSIVCDDCEVRCWVGQGDHIYKYEYISRFLHEHKNNHNLRFVDDSRDDKSVHYDDREDKNDEKTN